VANPGAAPCVVSISTVRNPQANGRVRPKPGTVVEVEGFVSARKTNDFLFVQEAPTGAPWQGIFIDAGGLAGTTTTGAKIGQKIKITGRRAEVFGVDQITAARIEVVDSKQEIMRPLAALAAQLTSGAGPAAEPYESLLVTVGTGPGSIAITQDKPDSGPFFEFEVTGNLRVDDFVFARYGTPAECAQKPCAYPPAGFERGKTFSSITGVMGFSFGNRKLYPRSQTDFGN